MDSPLLWLVGQARWLGYRSYYRLVAANYDHQWLSTENRTSAGRFQCYELLNRHGNDPMLAELDAVAGSDAMIYDIGANVGIFSLALAAGEPERRLLAVEPAPRICAQLRTNVECNSLGNRIKVIECGVGSTDDTRTFYISSYPELSAFDRESATRWEASLAGTCEVPIRRVDTLVESHPPPDAIKIDVEGAAPAVLRGARDTFRTHQPTLFIEVHEEELVADTGDEVRSVLETVDYTITERADYWRCEPPA